MNELPVPSSLADIEPRWMTSALRRWRPETPQVIGVDCSSVGVGFGFTGVVGRVHLTYETPMASAPRSIMVKLPMAKPDRLSAYRAAQVEQVSDAYFQRCAREVSFYQELAAESPSIAPQHFTASVDRRERAVVILLEDVADARQGDVLSGCSPDDAMAVIAILASFHAHWWTGQTEGSHRFSWLPDWNAGAVARAERYRQQVGPFLERWGDTLEADIVDIVVRLANGYLDVLRRVERIPSTIIHGDLHLDNILFLPSGVGRRACILDWQSVCRGPAIIDIAQFLIGSLAPESRRSCEDELLAHYARLLRHGGNDHDIYQIRAGISLASLRLLAGVVGWLSNAGATNVSGRELDLIEAALGDGRLVAALRDYDAAGVLTGLDR